MIKAVIFDMDGVLIDSEAFYLYRLLETCQEHNQSISLEQLKSTAGMSMGEFWDKLGSWWTPNKTPEEMQKIFVIEGQNDYADLANPHLHFILKGIKELGLKLAIASASEMTEIKAMAQQTKIESYFDCILSGCHLPKSKPDPLIYLETMKKLQVKPEECVVVEDSLYGIQAGKAAGAYVIAKADDRFDVDQSIADSVASDLLDVFVQIKELLK